MIRSLLSRQIKRALGLADDAQLKGWLADLEAAALRGGLAGPHSIPGALSEALSALLARVGETYSQYERDLALRSRSLDLSSDELTAVNARLRAEAESGKRVVMSLRDTARRLMSETAGAATEDSDDLEHLSSVMARLVRERQAARELAAQGEEKYRSLVESLKEVVFQIDKDGRWTFLNSAWTELTGMSVQETCGQPYIESLVAEDRLGCTTVFAALAAGRIGQCRHEVRCRHKTDDCRWVELFAQAVFDNDRRLVGINGTLSDVTHRKRSEILLVKAKDAAEAASRSKSEFLANMSHEIRTPMNGVVGMADLLLGTELSLEQKNYAETIKRSGEALLDIINDILDFSKIESGTLSIETKIIDLKHICDDVLTLLGPRAAHKGVGLSGVWSNAQPWLAVGDAGRVRQVLLNLVGNSIKFTSVGSIVVGIDLSPADTLRITVRDTGIGIAEDKIGLLFNRFSQIDSSATRRFGGTGLGLAISRRLIEGMGGLIGVESQPGSGTTFWFTLPIAVGSTMGLTPPPLPPTRPTPAPSSSIRQSSLKVLLVEDNAVNQEVATRMLQRLGCSVDLAKDGEEAVTKQGQGTYDLILMDCHMPTMDGFTATRLIRAGEAKSAKRPIPIVALTANAMSGDRENCLAAGMNDHLSKPIRLETLAEAVTRWAAGVS